MISRGVLKLSWRMIWIGILSRSNWRWYRLRRRSKSIRSVRLHSPQSLQASNLQNHGRYWRCVHGVNDDGTTHRGHKHLRSEGQWNGVKDKTLCNYACRSVSKVLHWPLTGQYQLFGREHRSVDLYNWKFHSGLSLHTAFGIRSYATAVFWQYWDTRMIEVRSGDGYNRKSCRVSGSSKAFIHWPNTLLGGTVQSESRVRRWNRESKEAPFSKDGVQEIPQTSFGLLPSPSGWYIE